MKYPERQAIALQPLTPKALKFCELIAKGHRAAEAYLTAYDVSATTKQRSIQVAASKLLGDPRVKRQVERLKQRQEAAMAQTALGLKEWTLQRLKEEASDSENPPAARVSALALLAKASKLIESGSQVQVNVANVSRPSAEIEEEILARLSAVSVEASAIHGDIDAEPVDTEEADRAS
jgi:hypothetical protein